ncbi:MAG: poly-gamma-glutamate synthase PgsB [Deltaproteobacteria bacterium]|nr:poly-gamma-glutamate synthase PgsB [Deltaproteobacteria bacterium]
MTEFLYIWIFGGVIAFLLVLGFLEIAFHRRNLSRIPVRVHVNGTRGKSSLTRLIASGLRAGGIRTCAKTTGTLPRMILPDGSEFPVFRPSKANVIEQLRIVRKAVGYDAKALVIECMALQPYLQTLCEAKLVRATHGVITNARRDHLDVMGPGEEDVALALAGMVPPKKILYTAERKHLGLFADAAKDRGTKLVGVTEDDVEAITEKDLAGFSYVEHAENVALALKVCADLGVDRRRRFPACGKGNPIPG